MGVDGIGLPGVRGRIQRRGLASGSVGGGGKVGEIDALGAVSEADDDDVEDE
jgi:hypothetical protein